MTQTSVGTYLAAVGDPLTAVSSLSRTRSQRDHAASNARAAELAALGKSTINARLAANPIAVKTPIARRSRPLKVAKTSALMKPTSLVAAMVGAIVDMSSSSSVEEI
jgi:hypothetical protein